ncbi:histidinol dehydrogenase [Parasulfitobacter algicola]|uniref:Histidinol dehydrogenase n=1 Tax=Parasulfitobacter algicola TaxID=2614809 RepID=A0ABX2ITC1_9RHOB|nr:histidinol dehydrogenase [Sulfitobacter algicola]NSX56159.1 histidinol dehydrogenase [Sulfitobacter algicola]
MEYLKKAPKTAATGERDVRDKVQSILDEIEAGGDDVARAYTMKFDGYDGEIIASAETRAASAGKVSQKLKDDIRYARDNVRRFAEAQRASLKDTEYEIIPGLIAGQKQIPVLAAGCYAPGGRYSHVASAIMTVTTAKVAGVKHVSACSPPKPGEGMHPAILYALDVCGADTILNLGGVQGIAAMTFGLFGTPRARVLAGPGNQFVAEAKRILFGRVGIDMFAGPTESMVIADATADAKIVAADLVGQAEHGYNSPVWLISTDRTLAEQVLDIVPRMIDDLPELNKENAAKAWQDYGEVMVCDDRDEAVRVSDEYASEHLQVQAADLDWWLASLNNYGSLFLGEETTVAYGDKVSGPNHVLPTKGAAHYTGGLSVGKFIKTVTWQKSTREANRDIGQACARISRLEGMEGHARTADVRLAKYFPTEVFDLSASG